MANEHQPSQASEQSGGREHVGREERGRESPHDGGERGRRTSRPVRIQERGREAYRDAQHLASTLEQAVDEIGQFLREQAEQRPYASLATAAATGYVLGGGVPSRLTGFLFGLGSRLAVEMFLRELIGDAARQPSHTAASGRP